MAADDEKLLIIRDPATVEFGRRPSKTPHKFADNFNGYLQMQPRFYRSKSLSYLSDEYYSPGEIRRIRERLLRTNPRAARYSGFRHMTRRQKLTLASVALVDFMSFCSMSIMAPFFPREAAEKGLSDTLSGFVFSFYALIMFLTSPFFGKILPKFGARFLYLVGIFITGICNLLFGTMEYIEDYTAFTTLCIILRGFEALGASAFSTASYVFVVNSFPHNIGAVIGILETFVGLGMSTGPALGGLLYSFGGFSLPFFVLGIAMLVTVVLNLFLLPSVDETRFGRKSTPIFTLIRIPAVITTSLVVVIVSSTWSFMDPTLEPHLRQFNLSPEKIGLIFLLFSALYGIFSPIWGYVADRVHNHWSMMVLGLFFSTFGLLLLGPCPFIPFLQSSLWLTLLALCLLGVSVALALLPTFQGILLAAIQAGCSDSLATYSVVAGIWSCMYSLGEVVGPSLGGFLLQYYGFPVTATVMAGTTFTGAVLIFVYYQIRPIFGPWPKSQQRSEDSGISSSTSTWKTEYSSTTIEENLSESSPLLVRSFGSDTPPPPQYYYNPENVGKRDNYMIVGVTSKGASEI